MKEKMKKLGKSKLFKISSALVVVATIIVAIPFVFAEEKPTFYLEATTNEKDAKPVDLTKLHRGDTFRVNIMLKNATNYQVLGYTMLFDNRAFEYVQGSVYQDMDNEGLDPAAKTIAQSNHDVNPNNANQDYFAISIGTQPDYEEDYSYNGRIATVVLKVKDEARANYVFGVMRGESGKREDTVLSRKIRGYDPDAPDGSKDAVYENLEFEAEETNVFVEVPLNDISLSVSDSIDMVGGDEKTIEVIADPEDTTVEENASFESNKADVAEVNEDGVITAKATGQATITVNAYGKEKTVTVNVTNPIKRLYFEDEKVTIKGENKTKQLEVKTEPTNPDDGSVKWESLNPEIATVDSTSGIVTSHTTGTAVIKATSTVNDAISATIDVDVVIPVTSASIDKTSLNIDKGNSEDVTITYQPAVANTKVKWEVSDNSVISITEKESEAGTFAATVNAISGGKTKLKGTIDNCDDNVTCTFEVDVKVNVPLQTIKIQKDSQDISSLDLYPTQTANLSIVLDPTDATVEENEKVSWSSTNGNVQVSADGVVKAVNAGTTDTVTASFGGKTASIQVNVKTPVAGGNLVPGSDINLITNCNLSAKGKCQETMSVLFFAASGTPDESPKVTWGIKEGAATGTVSVSADGVVKAIKAGDTIVTATYTTFDGKTNTLEANVHVTVALESISFAKDAVTVHRNKTVDLPSLKLNPTDATVDPSSVTYEYDTQTININGSVITGLKKGSTVVKATLAGETAELTVTVDVPVNSISVKKDGEPNEVSSLLIARNNSVSLEATIDPIDADDQNIIWGIVDGQPKDVVSINSSSRAVNNIGTINALKKGKTKIYVKVGEVTKTIDVEVNVPVESFTADTSLEVLRKSSKKINVTINPTDADDQEITWISDNDGIATVDKNGVVTGVTQGETDIKGTLKNGMNVTVHVTVNIIPLTDVDIELPDDFYKGKGASITVKPNPANSTEFENIKFESLDNDIFTVNENGVITGKKAGTAKLRITVGNVVKEIDITITEVSAESIGVYAPSDHLGVGEQMQLQPYCNPENCTDDLQYTYKSSDPSIAIVDENGIVKGVKAGKVTITIIADNGMETTVDIIITDKVTEKEGNTSTINPETGVSSPIPYLILSLLSLSGIGVIGYNRFKLER